MMTHGRVAIAQVVRKSEPREDQLGDVAGAFSKCWSRWDWKRRRGRMRTEVTLAGASRPARTVESGALRLASGRQCASLAVAIYVAGS